MKLPTIPTVGSAVLAGISLVTPALAVVNIDYVTVGNAGNANDAATGSVYGAVAYAYQIAKNGAYTLLGAMSGIISKNGGAKAWIPSESEWYKAAYYDPNQGGAGVGGYWLHANQSNTMAGNTIGVANSANYNDGDYVGYPGAALTVVGAYGLNSDSAYGTNDHAGNVWEWNDAVIFGSSRGLRGGSWASLENDLRASGRFVNVPSDENFLFVRFRVASVPEPTCLVLTMLASGVMLIRRKR